MNASMFFTVGDRVSDSFVSQSGSYQFPILLPYYEKCSPKFNNFGALLENAFRV